MPAMSGLRMNGLADIQTSLLSRPDFFKTPVLDLTGGDDEFVSGEIHFF
jgi:hypothetical protein